MKKDWWKNKWVLLIGGFLGSAISYFITCVICFLFLAFASCTTQRVIETIQRDTIVKVEPDKAALQALLECDSNYNVVIKALEVEQGKRVVVTPEIIRDTLTNVVTLKADCQTDTIYIPITKVVTKETIIQKEIPKYYKTINTIFWIVIAVVVLYIAAKILIRIYLKR